MIKIKKKIMLIVLLMCVLIPTITATQQEINVLRQSMKQEIDKGNKVIIEKINHESDLCYANIDNSASSYFYELREEFKTVFWMDRVITMIGNFLSFVLAFLCSYFYIKKLEKKKEAVKHGR